MHCNNKEKGTILNIFLLLYSMIFQMFILNKLLKYHSLISASFMLIILAIAICIIGLKKDKKTNLKKNIFYKTVILVILFFSITYLLGLFIGFNRNAYSRSPLMLLNNMFAPIFLIICIEIYRYILVDSTNKYSKMNIFTTFTLTIFEILTTISISSLFQLAFTFEIITTKVIPIICKNIAMNSLCKYGGLRSTLLYRLIMDTYIYIVPIIPDFSDFLISILGICFPFLAYVYTINDIKEDKGKTFVKPFKDDFNIGDSLILTSIICIAMLLSGFFPLVLIGVGSWSMHPKIDKGDAIIYRKIKNDNDIKVGDVLVFKSEDKILVHRLVEKKKENGVIYYITKGDNNKSIDNISTNIDDIKGVVSFKIKYIAKPSIWFNDFMDKRS